MDGQYTSSEGVGRDQPKQTRRNSVRCCVGFWTPATRRFRTLNRPASKKRQRHEVAGSSAPAEQRALRGFVRGARLRKFEEWRPRPRAQLKRYGTIVAK